MAFEGVFKLTQARSGGKTHNRIEKQKSAKRMKDLRHHSYISVVPFIILNVAFNIGQPRLMHQ